jgi:hypothetical protein
MPAMDVALRDYFDRRMEDLDKRIDQRFIDMERRHEQRFGNTRRVRTSGAMR